MKLLFFHITVYAHTFLFLGKAVYEDIVSLTDNVYIEIFVY